MSANIHASPSDDAVSASASVSVSVSATKSASVSSSASVNVSQRIESASASVRASAVCGSPGAASRCLHAASDSPPKAARTDVAPCPHRP